jgi:hypothetical protein
MTTRKREMGNVRASYFERAAFEALALVHGPSFTRAERDLDGRLGMLESDHFMSTKGSDRMCQKAPCNK